MKILCGTDWIDEDEPCLKLWEEDEQPPDNSGKHRYRIFRVLRDGVIKEFREDLGGIKKFLGVEPIVIWAGVIDGGVFYGYNVGESREMLDQYRNHVHFDLKEFTQLDKINVG